MSRRTGAFAVLVAVAAVLTGCTAPDAAAPSASVSATPVPSPSVSGTPSAAPTAAPGDGDEGSGDGGSAPETPVEVPASWTDEDLIGACKVAWNESGQVVDWSQYSPDAAIEDRDNGHYVAFSGSREVRDCLVGGSPAAPEVVLQP